TKYNVNCECEGCLDEERNDRMEGWRCRKCEDGWLPPHINAKCSSVEHILKYGNELLSLEEQYLNKDDIALFYLRIGLTHIHNLDANHGNHVRLLNGIEEVDISKNVWGAAAIPEP
ncbi:hypothetical protein TELCIR_13699, partial [Teladorsagia circumcincta]